MFSASNTFEQGTCVHNYSDDRGDDGNAEKRQMISASKQQTVDFVSAKHRRSTQVG